MSWEDLFLILTRGETHRLSEPNWDLFILILVSHRLMRMCVCVSVCESTSTCLIRFAFLVTVCVYELHRVSPTLFVFFPVFFFRFAVPHILLFFVLFTCFISLRLLELIYSLLEVLCDFCDCGHLATRILLFLSVLGIGIVLEAFETWKIHKCFREAS